MTGIVSLLPSATEWVCALGLEDRLVGVTFECDAPAGVREGRAVVVDGLPTRTADGTPLPPGEIDALVRARLAAGQPLYTLDAGTVRALGPDVVLTQDLCAVCALPAEAARDAVALLGEPARVVTLDPHTLDDVLAGATAVAAACGVPDAGQRLHAGLRRRLDAVSAAVRGRPRPRVLVLEWTDPPFVAGHWVPDVVDAAGAEPVLADRGGRSTTTTWEQVGGRRRRRRPRRAVRRRARRGTGPGPRRPAPPARRARRCGPSPPGTSSPGRARGSSTASRRSPRPGTRARAGPGTTSSRWSDRAPDPGGGGSRTPGD